MNPPVPYGYRLLGDNEVMPEGTLRIDGIDSTPEWLPGQDLSAGKTVKQFKDQFHILQVECVCAPVEVPEGHRLRKHRDSNVGFCRYSIRPSFNACLKSPRSKLRLT